MDYYKQNIVQCSKAFTYHALEKQLSKSIRKPVRKREGGSRFFRNLKSQGLTEGNFLTFQNKFPLEFRKFYQ